ncbi:MAG: exodeoxyribonuclease VII large subunit [Alphaproteobacteria bacterium]|nr:exodeoxyribonuclease VII large subunit [Alphaproteobacteria bacterium]
MNFIPNQPEYSVSEIAGHVKRMVEETFGYVRVRGELSKVGINAASGHAYITMKDDKAVLDAVCWKGTLAKLAHKPEAGMEVIATGRLTTYPGASKYQLVIESLEPAGIGALMAMLEQRKAALAKEGLFDPARKQEIPFLPNVIGIVTSPTGAVIRDMLHRIGERFARHVILWPVPVQGQGAAEKIAAAIAGFNALPVGDARRPDVLIVARGGGSIEDLWAFNEEVVVRAAAASAIPLISAVGHETDTTLIDYAADKRAPTPTAAAEIAVPVRAELLTRLEQVSAAHHGAARKLLAFYSERIQGLARGLPRPQQWVAGMEQALDGLGERLALALPRSLRMREESIQRMAAGLSPGLLREMLLRQEQRVQHLAGMLASLNVLAVMKRGFVLVKDTAGTLVTSAAAMPEHARLTLQFYDGERLVTAGHGASSPATKPRRQKKPSTQPGLFDD